MGLFKELAFSDKIVFFFNISFSFLICGGFCHTLK